jgi:hypothetical protein
MQAALRPMNLGEILDRTFAIYRKKFLLFVGIAAMPAAVMLGIHSIDVIWVHTDRLIGMDGEDRSTRMILNWLRSYGYYHISGFVQSLILPAFVHLVSGELFGESYSILGSLRFFWSRWRTYLRTGLLKMGAQLVGPEAVAFGLFFAVGTGLEKIGMTDNFFPLGAVFFLLLAALFAAFFWMGTSLAFAMPAAALEETSAWKALKRSWNLTRGSRWRIFVAWIMAFACAMVMAGVVASLAWWIATAIYTGHHRGGFNQRVYELIVYFFYALIRTVVGPLYPIAVTLFYYDQRARKEGFDVELMMAAAKLVVPAPAASPSTASVEKAAVPAPDGVDA